MTPEELHQAQLLEFPRWAEAYSVPSEHPAVTWAKELSAHAWMMGWVRGDGLDEYRSRLEQLAREEYDG